MLDHFMFQKMQSQQQHGQEGIQAAVQLQQPPHAHNNLPQETISLAVHHSHGQQETIPGGVDRLHLASPPPQQPPPAGPSSQQIKSERLYKCNLCDKAYTQDHNLKHHIKSVHEGIVPSNSNNAVRSPHDGRLGHEYQHGMQRPKKEFFCNICNKLYIQRQGLKHHIRVWHEGIKSERLHKCSLCGKLDLFNFDFNNRIIITNYILMNFIIYLQIKLIPKTITSSIICKVCMKD